uniref:Uncharacterized protein n=1 Tax=Nelumbo nucifera TaxID=4432 RepID=A0A822YRC6_NELNU|nr:TPA_asm: hypothetical protein HUJ06_004751 [Nelumbo nucifera]
MILPILYPRGTPYTQWHRDNTSLPLGQWKRVADFIDAEHNCWKEEELRNVFGEESLQSRYVYKLPKVVVNSEDLLVWSKDPHGFLTTTASYRALRLTEAQSSGVAPAFGSVSWKKIGDSRILRLEFIYFFGGALIMSSR